MNPSDAIVACGGWFRREICFKPFYLLAGTAALGAGLFTAVAGSITLYVWLHDGAMPEAFLLMSSGIGLFSTLLLSGLTVVIGKKERQRKIAVMEANRKTDPRRLY